MIQNCEDVAANVGLNIGGIAVDWLEPSVSDNSGTATLVSRSHSPGQFFVVGVTQVSYRFVDASGNAATCTFNVIVNEGKVEYCVCAKYPINYLCVNNCKSKSCSTRNSYLRYGRYC